MKFFSSLFSKISPPLKFAENQYVSNNGVVLRLYELQKYSLDL